MIVSLRHSTALRDACILEYNLTVGAQNEADMLTAGCNTACVKYRWVDSQNRFRYVGGSWDYKLINGCIKDADAVGVYMKATHPMLTSWFFPSITLSDRTVMTFEPLPSGKCAPGAHN